MGNMNDKSRNASQSDMDKQGSSSGQQQQSPGQRGPGSKEDMGGGSQAGDRSRTGQQQDQRQRKSGETMEDESGTDERNRDDR